MTPQEFKAWFDGFTEAMDDKPTNKQWERIKARVAEIDGKPVTERVYVDRYYRNFGPIWAQPYNGLPYAHYATCNVSSAQGASVSSNLQAAQAYALAQSQGSGYDSCAAMNTLGRADAAELN